MVFGFTLLTIVTVRTYKGALPIPARAVSPTGQVLFTMDDVNWGQDVFFKYGLMEHGTLWGHGAYLGPDYTAEYLHRLTEIVRDTEAQARYGKLFANLTPEQAHSAGEMVKVSLKQNRYDENSQTLTFTAGEQASFRIQKDEWRNYFSGQKRRNRHLAFLMASVTTRTNCFLSMSTLPGRPGPPSRPGPARRIPTRTIGPSSRWRETHRLRPPTCGAP